MRSLDSRRQAVLDETSDRGDADRTLLAFCPTIISHSHDVLHEGKLLGCRAKTPI